MGAVKTVAVVGLLGLGGYLAIQAMQPQEADPYAGGGGGGIPGEDSNWTDISKALSSFMSPSGSTQESSETTSTASPTGTSDTAGLSTKKSSSYVPAGDNFFVSPTATQSVDIFTKSSESDSNRFAVDTTTGAIADRYAQQSITPEEATRRKKAAATVDRPDLASYQLFTPKNYSENVPNMSVAPSSPNMSVAPTSSTTSSNAPTTKKQEKKKKAPWNRYY